MYDVRGDHRQHKGLEIAATAKIAKKGGAWLVPSQSGKGRYTVCLDPKGPHCSCPDHEEGGHKCKFACAKAIAENSRRYIISRRLPRAA
jgi:hypothetical protein